MQKNCCESKWVLILCGWLLGLPLLAAEIQVGVDRNPVNLSESFQITFSASETPDGSPDFTPLEENFEILNQQRSSNMSWINGKSSRNEQWTLSVMPKQSGELLIPPIAFGADSSKPTKVNVTDTPVTPNNNDDVFLQVEATPEKPYVQSQVLYTLKLYRRIQITQASLNEPEIKDALVEKLGEDSTYSTQINGVDYWVTERKYAIFPQQSGLFTIAPLTLTADVVVTQQRPRFNGFFNRQTTETRRVSSKAITISVQPVPQSYTSPTWLSAESLTLKDSWSNNNLQSKVGEPLTRSITLRAKGATVGQLPELANQTAIDGIKTYPDQPLLNEEKQSDGLVAVREEKIAYIPSKPGQYTLPELAISWFNTRTQKTEVAQLAAVTITALAASDSNQSASLPLQTQAASEETPTPEATPASNEKMRFWQFIALALGLGWLLTIAWFKRHVWQQSAKTKPAKMSVTKVDYHKALKTACQHNNPQAAKQALLQWGASRFGVDNLGALASLCSPALAQEIQALNRHLYAERSQPWQGSETLWQLITDHDEAQRNITHSTDDALAPLYKI